MDAIFDRTEDDILNHTAKAYLNAEDFNRIETNCKELAELLNVSGLITKLDWTIQDFPTSDNIQRIIGNVSAIREAWYTYRGTPEVPKSMKTWQQLNDLERIIWDVYTMKMDNNNAVCYAGEFYAGERGLI